jgi:hypothetical protein
MRRWVLVAVWLLGAVAWTVEVRAQGSVLPQPDASVGSALNNLASRAAVVFAGQVTSIQRKGGVVEITFRVDTPVVGQAGGSYTLREWAGMWPPGQSRYHLGERAMVFLHGASAAGLSSAVDGSDGVIPLVRGTDGTPLLEVRRLSTRALRKVGQPLADTSTGAITLADAVQVVTSSQTGVRREPSRRPLPPENGVSPKSVPTVGPPAPVMFQVDQRGVMTVVERSGNDAQ